MFYHRDEDLEQSAVVANCSMNRERELDGSNGYAVEIGLQPLTFLRAQLAENRVLRWLDLCCGTGKALIQAATIVEQERFPLEIVGVDLVGMFLPHQSPQLTLLEASLSTFTPEQSFDLITCIHGLHYIGNKLQLISRACSWLNAQGLFIASLDSQNLRLHPSGSPSKIFASELRRAGLEYVSSKRLLKCKGRREFMLPFTYLGADDQAGPNYTKQPVVNSLYESI